MFFSVTYNKFTSEGVLKDWEMFSKSLILQTAVMFSLSLEQVHLVSVQTLLSPTLFSAKMTRNITKRLD